jgi:TolA-binding protein
VPTARLRHVQCLIILERNDDALAEADRLKADLPKFAQMAELDYARGRALQAKARFDEARAAFQAVIAARPGVELAAKAQLMRGETFFHQRQYREALKEFLKVDYFYQAPMQQAAALLEAGKVYEGLDQPDDAAEIYEKVRSKFPANPSAVEAGKRLDALRGSAGRDAARPASERGDSEGTGPAHP